MKEYQSIKPKVLARIKRELPVLRERYGIETIGIFGSVPRGEDTPGSDLDIISSFRPEMDTHENQPDPEDFLETSFRESRSGLCRTNEQEVPCKRDDGGCGALISSK